MDTKSVFFLLKSSELLTLEFEHDRQIIKVFEESSDFNKVEPQHGFCYPADYLKLKEIIGELTEVKN